MTQDSGTEPKTDTSIDAAMARALDEVRSEPVPEGIVDLAKQLESALQSKRRLNKATRG